MDTDKLLEIIKDKEKLEECNDIELATISAFMQGIIIGKQVNQNKAS